MDARSCVQAGALLEFAPPGGALRAPTTSARSGATTEAHRDPDLHACDVAAWPDAWLVTAVRAEPPNSAALDTLVARHWKPLFARCQALTQDRDAAADLAQETWCRLLRARSALEPGGNLTAYLTTIATNIWRDRHRLARRAGALGDGRLASLDAPSGDGDPLAASVPDPYTLGFEEQAALRMDLDRALARLTPRARDVLVARLLDGESAAEIGHRYGRTEQTITAWVRRAAAEIAQYLDDVRHQAPASGRAR